MISKTSAALLCAAGLVLALMLVWLLASPRTASNERLGVEATPQTLVEAPVSPSSQQRQPERAGATATTSVRPPGEKTPAIAFLEAFWGDRWPEVQAKLEAAGKQLDNRPPPTKTWEQAAAEIEKRLLPTEEQRKEYEALLLRWSGKVDDLWLRQQFEKTWGLDEAQRAIVHDIVLRHNRDLEPIAADFLNGLDAETRSAWYGGKFIHAPYTTTGAPGADRPGFYSKGDAQDGWACGYTLSWDEAPYLKSLQDKLKAGIAARDREVSIYAISTRKR